MKGSCCAYKKCHNANVQIAPFDPERVQRNLEIFHRGCLTKQREEEQLNCRIGHQLSLGFTVPAMMQ